MKKYIKNVILIELIISIFILILKIIVLNKVPYLLNYINMVFWCLLAIITYFLLGFPKDRNYLKNITIRYVIIYLLGYTIILYLLGLFTGFTKTVFSLNISNIIKTIIPITIFIISKEIIRYIVSKQSLKNMKPIISLTILYCIFSIIMTINNYNFDSLEQVFVFVFAIFIPIIAKEVLCSYVTYNISLIPTIIYILALELNIYILPIFPNLGNYLSSVIGLLFPYFLYKKISQFVKYNEKKNLNIRKDIRNLIIIPISIVSIIIVILTSGIFQYKMIAIGSDSMNPIYYLGDAIIYTKTNPKDIKEEDILVYDYKGITVTHRVNKITKKGNTLYFQTKGDNNKEIDKELVSEENVKGTVKYIVKYIGYPTIWLNQFFREW